MHAHAVRTTVEKLALEIDSWNLPPAADPQVVPLGGRDLLLVLRHEHDHEHTAEDDRRRPVPHGADAAAGYDVEQAERVRRAIVGLLDGVDDTYADDVGGAHAPVLPSVTVAIEQSHLDDRRRAEDPVLTDARRAELAQFEDGRRGGLQWGAAKEWQRWRRAILAAAGDDFVPVDDMPAAHGNLVRVLEAYADDVRARGTGALAGRGSSLIGALRSATDLIRAYERPGTAVSREDLAFAATQLQAHVAADAGIKVDARRCNETAARFRAALGG